MLEESETKKRRAGENSSGRERNKGPKMELEGYRDLKRINTEKIKKERKGRQKEKRLAVAWLFVDLW